jgi:hypothetical protein
VRVAKRPDSDVNGGKNRPSKRSDAPITVAAACADKSAACRHVRARALC